MTVTVKPQGLFARKRRYRNAVLGVGAPGVDKALPGTLWIRADQEGAAVLAVYAPGEWKYVEVKNR
jgi:hypothetical protein